MNILLWHVHGSWTTAFVQGKHRYLVPVNEARDAWGRGRAQTFDWPDGVEEHPIEEIRDVDIAIVQRPEELDRVPSHVPVIYVEHNTPKGDVPETRHPMADRDDLIVAHVTHFNELFWDCGSTRTRVVEHGIPDPGRRYTGEVPRAAVVVNEARRRGRVTGTDLLGRLERAGVPVDLFGMDAAALGGVEDLPQDRLHTEMARRGVYVHPIRWTSLGLSLVEAMHLGMPVVALATTEAVEAVPPQAGVISTRVDVLAEAALHFLRDAPAARAAGDAARAHALQRFGLDRFLHDWDELLTEVMSGADRAGLGAR